MHWRLREENYRHVPFDIRVVPLISFWMGWVCSCRGDTWLGLGQLFDLHITNLGGVLARRIRQNQFKQNIVAIIERDCFFKIVMLFNF